MYSEKKAEYMLQIELQRGQRKKYFVKILSPQIDAVRDNASRLPAMLYVATDLCIVGRPKQISNMYVIIYFPIYWLQGCSVYCTTFTVR